MPFNMIGGVIMSNDEYMKLYEQFKPMIIKLCNKWSRISVIEYDELMQIALLALIAAHNTYDETKGKKFSSYVYDMIEYRMRKEIYIVDKKNKNKSTISLNTVMENGEGDTAELIDLIADKVDLQEEIEDKLMIQTYKTEIEKYLGANKSNICILRWFEDCPYEYIKKVTGISNIHGTLRESRMTLIRKSLLFRNEYRRIHDIDDYSHTERLALLDS